MCAGAILGARVRSLVFGAFEPKTGAVGSLFDALRDPRHLHIVEVRAGVREAECAALLTEFFADLRSPETQLLSPPEAGGGSLGTTKFTDRII